MSSVYCPLPVMKRWSSLRRTGAPIPLALTGILLGLLPLCLCLPVSSWWRALPTSAGRLAAISRGGPCSGHRRGAVLHGGDDIVIAGAAAQVAFQSGADRRFVEFAPRALDQIDGGHDHAGRKEPALQSVVLP